MDLGELKLLARSYLKEATKRTIKDNVLELILNNGAVQVAKLAVCLPENKKIDGVANQQEYRLRDHITDFLTMDKPGVWYREDAMSDYQQLYPRTMKWLDRNNPNWRDETSSTPTYYAVKGDVLTVVPAFDTDVSDGLWVYYGAKPPRMNSEDHYPFGGSDLLPHLEPLHETILLFWQWKGKMILNNGFDEYRAGEKMFLQEVARQASMFKRRADVNASDKTRMQGRKIR